MNKNNGLPTSWACPRLADAVELNPRFDRSPFNDSLQVSFVPMAAVEAESGQVDASTRRPFGAVRKGYTPFLENDIIFAKITPCMENGKIAVVPKLLGGVGFGSTEFHVLRSPDGIEPRWVFFYLLQPMIRRDARRCMTGSAGQLRVPEEFLASLAIPIAPTKGQRRIVEEVEKQFTRLDAGVAALKRVEANLRRYKAAVLKAAVEGRLTERWRAEHPDAEPASELLKRILTERRRRWEQAELAKLRAKGKPPTDDRWKQKYKEPIGPDSATLAAFPELPGSWTWATVDQLAVVVRGGSPRPAGDPRYFGGDVPWITVGPITADDEPFLVSVPETLTAEGKERSRWIDEDTLLLTNSGATLGVPKITRIGGCINDGVAALLFVEYPMKLFLYFYLWGRTQALRAINQGAAQPNLNTGIIRSIVVPLPPLQEQQAIVEELDTRVAALKHSRSTVEGNMRRASRLRQSILKRAFEGKLVPQDPNDEPASVLLDRIRAERAKMSVRPGRQGGRKTRKTGQIRDSARMLQKGH